MDAILNIFKPAGMSSFQCVAAIKKIIGSPKAGHAGTLDPEAEGVLPICIGKATKCAEFFLRQSKEYRAEITFGFATNTMDIWGEATAYGRKKPDEISLEDINAVLPEFTGEILQIPPMFSAIKKGGTPMYKLARRGEVVDIEPRRVNIYSIFADDFRIEGGAAKARLTVECSKGTYIRSICSDIGARLGTLACMSALLRSRYGDFRAEEAVLPQKLQEAVAAGRQHKFIYPLDFAIREYPFILLNADEETDYINGKKVIAPFERIEKLRPDEMQIRVYTERNTRLLAVANGEVCKEGLLLKPWKYFGDRS